MAKQIVCEAKGILLPEWTGAGELENPPRAQDVRGQVYEGRRVHFPARVAPLHRSREEFRFVDYVPDITTADDEGELLVEVRYRHPVDDAKISRVRADGRRMIEIDLSSLQDDVLFDMESFRRAVLEDPDNRVWLSKPDAYEQWRIAKRDLNAMVAERNRQIEVKRDAMEEATRRRQAEADADTRDSAGRRDYMRNKIRKRHAADLAVLMSLTDPAGIEECLKRWQLDAEARINELLSAVDPAIRSACLRYHHDAWVFGVSPVLWQLLAYRHFVADKQGGMRFNNRDVAAWVRISFPAMSSLYRLFVEQYRSLKEARRAGFNKYRLSCWAFTEEENQRIPHFYAPVNDFLGRLEEAQVIRALPCPIGEYEICGRPPHGLRPSAATG